ncbi:flagellar protein FliT [Paraburkholderia graminis]|uniref:flagellar protein FliT n=1 Tax=Paraburkholderia graminis TaxID=60548 RepID=UPI00278DB550|nr:flagellar protein FliT [Paraburkholderia graminis]MDQ0627234.1 flagellar protein FliT [Paraburkholderia graminis]
MTSNAEYFACYEAIAALSCRMMMAARRALWNDLVDLEEEYVELVDALKEAGTGVELDETERLRKYALIRQILADDAAIRDLANPSPPYSTITQREEQNGQSIKVHLDAPETADRLGATSET